MSATSFPPVINGTFVRPVQTIQVVETQVVETPVAVRTVHLADTGSSFYGKNDMQRVTFTYDQPHAKVKTTPVLNTQEYSGRKTNWTKLLWVILGILALIGAIVGILFAAGVFRKSNPPTPLNAVPQIITNPVPIYEAPVLSQTAPIVVPPKIVDIESQVTPIFSHQQKNKISHKLKRHFLQ